MEKHVKIKATESVVKLDLYEVIGGGNAGGDKIKTKAHGLRLNYDI